MNWEQECWQKELNEIFGDAYDVEYVPIWHAQWMDFEENGWIYVMEREGVYYIQEGGYSVMASDNTPCWCPYKVNEEQLWEILLDWEKYFD